MHAWYGCLREEIDRQWMTQKPHILAEYRCTCNIFLDGSGKLSDLKLLSTTGPTELDSSFLASIKQAFLVQPYLCELGRNRKFRMDFDESEQPKIHFKIIE